MGYLLRRELKYRKADIVRDTLILLAAPLLCMVAYMAAGGYMRAFGQYIYMLPEPAYRLLGLGQASVYNYNFYLKVIIIFSNIYVMWNMCNGVFYDVNRDENNGSVFFMCGQLYPRKIIILSKYIASAAAYAATYILWFAGMMVMAAAAGIKYGNIADRVKEMFPMLYGGIIVGILFISFTYIYAVYGRKKDEYQASAFVSLVVFGTLVFGNLYKVKNVVLWIMDYLRKPHPGLSTKLGFLDGFRWISPLSWINPFEGHDMKEWLILTLAAFIISGVSVAAAVFLYEKRTLEY